MVALKDAEDLLHQVLNAVDRNGDGKIQYEGRHNSQSFGVVVDELVDALSRSAACDMQYDRG